MARIWVAPDMAKKISVSDTVRVRFVHATSDFDDGVEVGLALAQIGMELREFVVTTSPNLVEMLRDLASRFGYRVVELSRPSSDAVELFFQTGSRRPILSIVN
jgi:hypothetical protein